MPQKTERADNYNIPWYALSANRLIATLGTLKNEVNCDICVIGGGFTGISTALELAEKDFSVILLEKETIAFGASGRNGGQIIRGYAKSPEHMIEKFGINDTKLMCNLTLEGLELIQARVAKYRIKCDLKMGHLTAAFDDGHVADLQGELKAWAKIGHNDLQLLDKNATQSLVKAKTYVGGLFDPKGAHFHPVNYALGVAQAAQSHGCMIYDETEALEIVPGAQPKVITARGTVRAKYVILAGAIQLKGTEQMIRKSITATAHMIATEPLGERRARNIMSKDVAVSDARFIMDYYRFSADYRMLFGGNCNYSDLDLPGEGDRLRQRMVKLFPTLQMARIDHCWRGPLEFTLNRMPDIGRITPQVYYAHGFGGQGVIATNIVGKVLAEAVAGQAQRYDVFARIKHAPFMGGNLLKRPLFVLGMIWYQLRDLL